MNEFDNYKAQELIEFIKEVIQEADVENQFNFTRKGIKSRDLEIENKSPYEYTTVEKIGNYNIEIKQKGKVYVFKKDKVNVRSKEHWCIVKDGSIIEPINKEQFKDYVLKIVKLK